MKYVYILRSINSPEQRYVGVTGDLRTTIEEHNRGRSSKYKPWKIEVYVAFRDPDRADAFEKYLKSSSGREFPRRYFRVS